MTIVEYDKCPDMWYMICDSDKLLTDIFVFNNTSIPYKIQDNRSAIMVSSATNLGKEYIARYINQFDNYESYYKNKFGTLVDL